MKLYEYLKPELILLDLEEQGVESTVRHLVSPLMQHGLLEAEEVIEALLERETRQSTAIGGGVAIPHAACQEIDAPLIALAISQTGIDFGSMDEQPVHIFFLLLSPPGSSGTHIKLLARIARLMRQPAHRQELLTAKTSAEIIERIRQLDDQHP